MIKRRETTAVMKLQIDPLRERGFGALPPWLIMADGMDADNTNHARQIA
jgi:hypothetical protein